MQRSLDVYDLTFQIRVTCELTPLRVLHAYDSPLFPKIHIEYPPSHLEHR